ncbi:MAG: metal ABC transporter substrate-binding protein [Oscillospiraceae bacterium]
MKKRIIGILAGFFALLFMAGCTPQASSSLASLAAEEDKVKVVTTIFPPYDFIRQIGGQHVEVSMLLAPGAESHSFEPSPKDIITIQESDIFIYAGGENDTWVERILGSMDRSGKQDIAMIDLVEAVPEEVVEGMEEEYHEHEEGEEEHAEEAEQEEAAELDEHVWTSPQNAITITRGLCSALIQADEANSGDYTQKTEEYVQRLQKLDENFTQAIGNASKKTIVVGDRFPFRYLADAYGLTYYAAFVGCSTETQASVGTIAFLIDKVEQENIPVVFYIEFSSQKIADSICETTGAKKALLHSCHNVSKEDFNNGTGYIELMEENLKALKEALY